MTHLPGQTMREKIVATTIAMFAIMAQQYQKWKTYLEKNSSENFFRTTCLKKIVQEYLSENTLLKLQTP